MSTYFYAWQAAQALQEKGLLSILSGSLLLTAAWVLLPVLTPKKLHKIARRILSWTILVIIFGLIGVLMFVTRAEK